MVAHPGLDVLIRAMLPVPWLTRLTVPLGDGLVMTGACRRVRGTAWLRPR